MTLLSTIREKTQGWIAAIILGMIAVPFALWGINYYFGTGSVKVAEVNGAEISVDAYRRTLDDQRRALQQILGRGADPRALDTAEFRQRVLDGMIDEILVTDAIQAEGYRVSDTELAQQIRLAPQFQRDGHFDPQLYERLLRSAGMDPRHFEARLRNDVLVQQMQSGYAQSTIVSAADIEASLKLEAQQREASVAILKPSVLRNRTKVSNDAIEREYSQNASRYKTAERVRVDYLRLSIDDLAKGVQVSHSELQQALAEAERVATTKEERRASHILVKLAPGADAAAEKAAMSKIQALRARLVAGANFADVARQNSEDPGSALQGGDLGVITAGTLDKEFEKALFTLKKPGDLSAPVRSAFGLHLIKLTALKRGKATVDRQKVEAELRAGKAEQRFYDLSEQFRNLVYEQSDSLKPAAEALGLRVETSGWLVRGEPGTGALASPKVVEAAFDPDVLEQGRNSQAIELSPNTLIALRVNTHEPSRQRPLAEVRGEIETALLQVAQQQEAERLAQEAVQKLDGGQPFDATARGYGMDIQPAKLFGRQVSGVDTRLLQALFRAPHPAGNKPAYGSAILSDGSLALFELKRVVEPSKTAASATGTETTRQALEARRGAEYYDDFRAGLRSKAKLKIYKDQL